MSRLPMLGLAVLVSLASTASVVADILLTCSTLQRPSSSLSIPSSSRSPPTTPRRPNSSAQSASWFAVQKRTPFRVL